MLKNCECPFCKDYREAAHISDLARGTSAVILVDDDSAERMSVFAEMLSRARAQINAAMAIPSHPPISAGRSRAMMSLRPASDMTALISGSRKLYEITDISSEVAAMPCNTPEEDAAEDAAERELELKKSVQSGVREGYVSIDGYERYYPTPDIMAETRKMLR